ncbi:MAG TPA: hypothetical protein PK322_10850 [Opitutaceae bacterium]|nr:hypothetical protein [Opitutaceae bacterium]
MKKLTKTLACALCALGFLAALGSAPVAKAADDNIGSNVASIPVSSKLTAVDVESAITQSLIARKWVVRDKSDGQIVAHYQRGKNVATLTIRYDDTKIDIYAVGDSRGGGLPMRWIENLRKDIDVYLGRVLLTK